MFLSDLVTLYSTKLYNWELYTKDNQNHSYFFVNPFISTMYVPVVHAKSHLLLYTTSP